MTTHHTMNKKLVTVMAIIAVASAAAHGSIAATDLTECVEGIDEIVDGLAIQHAYAQYGQADLEQYLRVMDTPVSLQDLNTLPPIPADAPPSGAINMSEILLTPAPAPQAGSSGDANIGHESEPTTAGESADLPTLAATDTANNDTSNTTSMEEFIPYIGAAIVITVVAVVGPFAYQWFASTRNRVAQNDANTANKIAIENAIALTRVQAAGDPLGADLTTQARNATSARMSLNIANASEEVSDIAAKTGDGKTTGA